MNKLQTTQLEKLTGGGEDMPSPFPLTVIGYVGVYPIIVWNQRYF